MLDIAKVTGASYSTVQRFMVKNGIPRRDSSEAGKNRFECEHKKSSFLETIQSDYHREKQSLISKRIWSDPKMRKDAELRAQKKLSKKQVVILYLVSQFDGVFQANLVPVLKKDRTNVSGALKNLFERGLLMRKKQDNFNTKSFRSLQFKYFKTKNGTVVINSYLSRLLPENKEKLNALVKLYARLRKKPFNLSFGENQEKVLKIIKEKGPMFGNDFYGLVNLNNRAIGKSLSRLVFRGVLNRAIERNPNSLRDNPYQFRYELS